MTPGPEPTADELSHLFDTVVGTVTLRASDLGRQRDFYARAVGLEAQEDGPAAADLADAAGRTLIRLDSSTARGAEPLAAPRTGLFHTAFRYPDRATLGAAVARTVEAAPAFEGASDHGVSEAVYFRDPEGNGIELYRDRPLDEWPAAETGRVGMYTRPLDVAALLTEADPAAAEGAIECDVGHIHLQTADVEASLAFWRDVFGLDERQRFGHQAIFLAEGLYHHHLGANTWHSAGADPTPPDRPGLDAFELRLRSAARVDAAAARLEEAGIAVVADGDHVTFTDPDSNRILLRSR